MALVDRRDGGLKIRLTAQDHSYGVGRLFAHFREKLRSTHARHTHIGDHQCERPRLLHELQAVGAASRGVNFHLLAQRALNAIEHAWLVIHEKHPFGRHDGADSLSDAASKLNPMRQMSSQVRAPPAIRLQYPGPLAATDARAAMARESIADVHQNRRAEAGVASSTWRVMLGDGLDDLTWKSPQAQ